MLLEELSEIVVEQKAIESVYLKRYVITDFYLPKSPADHTGLSLLLINDGQDLCEMQFSKLYAGLLHTKQVNPLLCVGIHVGKDRRNEYGIAGKVDYKGRGAKAEKYTRFILEELLPFIKQQYGVNQFAKIGFAGFSLGGLSALDIAWHHPKLFSNVGVFSGSLWWRSKSLDEDYNDETDRIMHQIIRNSEYKEGLKFFFTTGSLDETADRNKNGIIDSIDDTLDFIKELKKLGYTENEINYINYQDGKHDIPTWGRAMPVFLKWGWGTSVRNVEAGVTN